MVSLVSMLALAGNVNSEANSVMLFLKQFRNCSAFIVVPKGELPERHFILYATPERTTYVIEFESEDGRNVVSYHQQGEWSAGQDGYAANWSRKNHKDWQIDHVIIWHGQEVDPRQPQRRLSRIGIHGVGLWAEWGTLEQDLAQLIEANLDRVIVGEDLETKRRMCRIDTNYGTISIFFDYFRNNLRVREIRIVKGPDSIIHRDEPKMRMRDANNNLVQSISSLQFDYHNNVMTQIARSTARKVRDDQGMIQDEIIEEPSVLLIKQIHFAAPGASPPDLVAPHLKPVPQGTRAISTKPELRPIEMEWRDGKVVKSIDQTALNVAEEMSKFQVSERAKARQRWMWIGLASFGGLVLAATVLWWWRSTRKSVA